MHVVAGWPGINPEAAGKSSVHGVDYLISLVSNEKCEEAGRRSFMTAPHHLCNNLWVVPLLLAHGCLSGILLNVCIYHIYCKHQQRFVMLSAEQSKSEGDHRCGKFVT